MPTARPKYEASYEINASLQISFPEFQQLVSHEVVPGHVTTFAYLQNLYVRGKAGFEATVLTMNTRAATLFEGIANNAILIAHGVTEIEQLAGRRHADRRVAGAVAGRRQEPVVVSHLGRRQAAGGDREDSCAAIFWSAKSAPTSCRAHGDGIRCWAGCICRRIAREQRKSRRCDGHFPRSACCRRSTAATAWWTSTPWTKYCGPRRKDRHKGVFTTEAQRARSS